MSLASRRGLLERIRRSKTAREQVVSSNLSEGIAFQIRATRDAQDMTQEDLARVAGMSQNNISRLESPEYGKHTITSLKRIADALDVALIVRFVPFSQYINWLSSTPYWDLGLSTQALTVPSFSQEEKWHVFDDHGTLTYGSYNFDSPMKVDAIGVTSAAWSGIPPSNPAPEAPDARKNRYTQINHPTRFTLMKEAA